MRVARSVLLLGCGVLAGAWVRSASGGSTSVAPTDPKAEAKLAQTRLDRLRHDVRGALSPALLSVDRLLASDDPATRRTAEIIIRSVERATALLDATRAAPAGDHE